MKRIIALFLACVMFLSACGHPVETNNNAVVSETGSSEGQAEVPSNEENSEEKQAETPANEDHSEEKPDEIITETVEEGPTEQETIENDSPPITESSSENDAPELLSEDVAVDVAPEFYNLGDPALLQYMEDSVSASLVGEFKSEDYIIENVTAIYYSKEYLEEVAYNSQANIFFGYTLEELDEQFQGKKYVFTLGENGETIVQPFEEYDDTYDQVVKNVAIGTGVILICVTVSVITGGVGAAPVSMVFAASAKTGTTMALSSGLFSSVVAGTIKGIQTGDFDEALKAGALAGSNSFKWGAITGALAGGLSEYSSLRNASTAIDSSKNATTAGDSIPNWRESEKAALEKLGGKEQVTYLGGKEVPWGTGGATRPDIVRTVGDRLEAIEVKNYDLSRAANRSELYSELLREITARKQNLPPGSIQRIVLDVTGRGYSPEFLSDITTIITYKLFDVYPNIPIEFMGAIL